MCEADSLRPLLRSTAAADALGVNLRTLHRLIDTGALRAHRIGRVIRVHPDELDRFLADNEIEPGSLGGRGE